MHLFTSRRPFEKSSETFGIRERVNQPYIGKRGFWLSNILYVTLSLTPPCAPARASQVERAHDEFYPNRTLYKDTKTDAGK